MSGSAILACNTSPREAFEHRVRMIGTRRLAATEGRWDANRREHRIDLYIGKFLAAFSAGGRRRFGNAEHAVPNTEFGCKTSQPTKTKGTLLEI